MNKAWLDERHLVIIESDTMYDTLTLKTTSAESFSLTREAMTDNAAIYHSENMLPVEKGMYIEIEQEAVPVFLRGIVRDMAFDALFSAQDEMLGASVRKEETTFRVWSPVADAMTLLLKDRRYPMTWKENGTWELQLFENLTGEEYLYEGDIHGQVTEIVDPYAKALTANSKKAVVYNESLRMETPRPKLVHTQDAIIYELHVRDASIHKDSGIRAKGKYLGLTERNTKTAAGYSTGLSYIKELGVTHIELLPVNDFARVDDLAPDKQYNWGYDPLFFLTPEGSYASTAADPFARIKELQQMIEAFHEEELGVILDVVFNHVFIMEESPFEQLVPGYYFRYHLSGQLSNGTGVGNDFASERHMARKFILDAVDYWLTHFQVDGFRFDLMGVIDKETMRFVAKRCKEESHTIILLGEGWNLPTAMAYDQKTVQTQAEDVPDIKFFNDFFRDTVKGSTFDFNDLGYINGKGRYIERLPQLVKGSADHHEQVGPQVAEVVQSVNYVESHDNHTLWDRLLRSNDEESDLDRLAMHQLATGLVLMSQGTPFIHAGQEFFRTKKGVGNSYISNDEINQLDWDRRVTFEEEIKFVRKLIAIRREFNVFRLGSKEIVRDRVHILRTPAPVFGYTLLEEGRDFAVYVNPTKRRYEIQLPSTGRWKKLASNHLYTEAPIEGAFFHLNAYEFLVIKKLRH